MSSQDVTHQNRLARRLGAIALQLALLAAVWWILKLDLTLVGAVAGVIVVSGLVPPRIGGLVAGAGMVALAALVFFHYGHGPVALVLLIFGLIRGLMGLGELRRPVGV